MHEKPRPTNENPPFRAWMVWGMWVLTLTIFAVRQGYGVVALSLNILSSIFAVVLTCSRNPAEKVNGIIRLVIEGIGIILLVLLVIPARDGGF